MKIYSTILILLLVSFTLIACAPDPTAADIQRDQQAEMTKEGNAKVGMPGIKNFREAKTMRQIQELCDKEIVTYIYLENMVPTVVPGWTSCGGKLSFIGNTIAYPLPYAAQFTAPESMQTYNVKNASSGSGENRSWGVTRLPQADPNGLYKPATADATWSLMKDPSSDKVAPGYFEPKLVCLPFKLPLDKELPTTGSLAEQPAQPAVKR